MKMPADLIDEDAVLSALSYELDAPPRLLPEDSTYPALRRQLAGTATWLHNQLAAARFVPTLEETIGASKTRHGIGPIAVWDLPSRIAYRALVDRLKIQLPLLLRSRTAFEEFQRRPLDHPGGYVVTADIASCYQNLDHGLALGEVGVQTGEHAAIDTIAQLLRETTGRAYGLPQQSHPSDILA